MGVTLTEMNSQSKPVPTESPDAISLLERYVTVVQQFVEMCRLEGVTVVGFTDPRDCYFQKMPVDHQEKVLENFTRYSEVCAAVHQDGKSLADDRHFLWRMIRRLNLRPCSEMFSRIDKEDFIEIYDPQFIQIFRNFKFFKVCSYTLDELLSRPWWELYRREDSITTQLMADALTVFKKEHHGIKDFNTGVHFIEEIDSPRRNRAILENKFFAPLYDDNGYVAAGVNVIKDLSEMGMGKGIAGQTKLSETFL